MRFTPASLGRFVCLGIVSQGFHPELTTKDSSGAKLVIEKERTTDKCGWTRMREQTTAVNFPPYLTGSTINSPSVTKGWNQKRKGT